MARSDRTGNRKMRNRQEVMRVPEMGYYLVVTDTEATERCYFEGLQDSLPDEVKQKLVIKVIETKTQNLIQKCHEMVAYDAQYRIPWIVFDRDQVPNFDEIISDAEAANIQVGWSNPCFEIWLYTYFGSMPTIHESWNHQRWSISQITRLVIASSENFYMISHRKAMGISQIR